MFRMFSKAPTATSKKFETPSLFKTICMFALLLTAAPAAQARRANAPSSFDSLPPNQQAEVLRDIGSAANYDLCEQYAIVNGACGVVDMIRSHGNTLYLGELSESCNKKPDVITQMNQNMTPEQREACAKSIDYRVPHTDQKLDFSLSDFDSTTEAPRPR